MEQTLLAANWQSGLVTDRAENPYLSGVYGQHADVFSKGTSTPRPAHAPFVVFSLAASSDTDATFCFGGGGSDYDELVVWIGGLGI